MYCGPYWSTASGMCSSGPYTDGHTLNLDWVIKTLNDFSADLDRILDTGFEKAKVYTDAAVTTERMERKKEIAVLRAQWSQFKIDTEHELSKMSHENAVFRDLITAKIAEIDDKVDKFDRKIQEEIENANARTDAAIKAAINNLINTTLPGMLANITVTNYFTGELMGVQDMFNYLAALHAVSSIKYSEVAAKMYKYNQFPRMGETYEDVARKGANVFN